MLLILPSPDYEGRVYHLESLCVTSKDVKMAKLVQTHLAQCSIPSSDPKKARVRAGQAHLIIFFLSASICFQLRGFPGPEEVSLSL